MFAILSSIGNGAIGGQADQDRFDELVGYAHGYSLMVERVGDRCQTIFPEFQESIREGTLKWRERNAPALREIGAQWAAYVDRDHKVAGLEPFDYDAKIEEEAVRAVRRVFMIMNGEDSMFARQHCRDYATVTLRSTKLYLEARLQTELEELRACQALCPNLKRSQ